ncbi:MAG TPA: PAS domain S-box protein, partial [Trueperaceae bacterium]|nr:PAS domain S-box protein [Trueperaceae bacterium]
MSRQNGALQRTRQEERRVVGGFLWAFLVLILVSIAIDALRLGRPFLRPAAVAGDAFLVLFLLGTIALNRWGRPRVAIGLAAGLLMLAGSALPLSQGVRDSAPSLLLFFVPLVVAGLLLDRTALRLTTGWALAVIVAAPLLHGETLFGGDGRPGVWELLGPYAMVLVFIAFLLDRFGLRFKESMREAFLAQASAQAELLEEKGFTDALIESLPGLFFVRDPEGRYVRWNRRFAEVTGYADEELPGLDPLALFEGDSRAAVARGIERVFAEGHASADVRVTSKDGRSRPYFLSATRVERGGRQFLVGTGIDRSEIDAARADIEGLNVALRERVERLVALRDIDRAIIGSLDIGLTLGVLLEQVTGRLQVPAARVLLYDETEHVLRHGASQGLPTAGARGLRVALGEGPSGTVARDRKRVVVTGR